MVYGGFHKTAEDGQPVFGCFYDFWGGITMIQIQY